MCTLENLLANAIEIALGFALFLGGDTVKKNKIMLIISFIKYVSKFYADILSG